MTEPRRKKAVALTKRNARCGSNARPPDMTVINRSRTLVPLSYERVAV